MAAADNKAIFQQFVAEVMNQGNLAVIDVLTFFCGCGKENGQTRSRSV